MPNDLNAGKDQRRRNMPTGANPGATSINPDELLYCMKKGDRATRRLAARNLARLLKKEGKANAK